MDFKDIKTADELESWYAEKEDILEGHVRDYAVPFGNVYHLDSPPRRSSNIRMSSAGSTAWRCRLSPMITPSAT